MEEIGWEMVLLHWYHELKQIVYIAVGWIIEQMNFCEADLILFWYALVN